MRNANRSISRSSRGKNHPLRRFIARHLTLSLALLILGVIVLSSVHAGALDDKGKSATLVVIKVHGGVAITTPAETKRPREGKGRARLLVVPNQAFEEWALAPEGSFSYP